MCYDGNAAPPVYGPALTTAAAEPVILTSADGAEFAAYLATPADVTGPGVLVLPDNRGLSGFYRKLAVRLAEQGHPALAIDYFGRTAGTGPRDADFPAMDHLLRLTPAGVHADIAAGAGHLRAVGCAGVVSLGFCMGGRFAFISALAKFGLAGAIGLYGYPEPIREAPGPTQLAGEMTAPVLGMFGGGDDGIPPEMVAGFAAALASAGVEHEIVTYPGAPHGFFEMEMTEFADASADAWRRILAFLDGR